MFKNTQQYAKEFEELELRVRRRKEKSRGLWERAVEAALGWAETQDEPQPKKKEEKEKKKKKKEKKEKGEQLTLFSD